MTHDQARDKAGVSGSRCLDAATVLDGLGAAVLATDADGVIGYWNAAAERLYGWSADEVLGCDCAEVFAPRLAPDLREARDAALSAGRTWTGWFVARRKDGSPVPVLVMDRGVYGAEGVLVGVVCVFTNISVALRPLLERSWDAAVVLGPDAVVRYASPAVEHLLGWTQAQLVGEEFTPLLHEEDRDTLLGALENLLAGDGGHRPVELRLRGGRGWMWCEVAVTNLLDDPALRGVVCHVRPSRQRAARERAEERTQQLQTALNSRLVIEQAKGYLAGREGIDPEVAFERLRLHARTHHLSLHGVCRAVLTGHLQVHG